MKIYKNIQPSRELTYVTNACLFCSYIPIFLEMSVPSPMIKSLADSVADVKSDSFISNSREEGGWGISRFYKSTCHKWPPIIIDRYNLKVLTY